MFKTVFFAVFAALCASTPLGAADYRLLRLDGQYVKWGPLEFGEAARVTFSFAKRRQTPPNAINCKSIDPLAALLAAHEIPPAAFHSEVEAAFRMWSEIAEIDFRYVKEPESADIVIGMQTLPRGIAYANVWRTEESDRNIAGITKASICLSPRVPWEITFDGRNDTYSIRQVVAHEIGHTIGLNHPGRSGQLMGYRYSEEANGIRSGDARGAAALYGPRLDMRLVEFDLP